MGQDRSKRKLAAIFSADVQGYSRLIEDDEAATVATLTAYRKMMSERIGRHNGRVVDATGDNLLAEFASVVDAVQSAIQIQEELARRNDDLPDPRRMEFRIGINLGDVIEEEGRLYGDGVNIAARIEGLAEGGGICVSAGAYEQVKNKIDLEGKYLGQFDVKNISEPVKVYALLTDAAAMGRTRARRARRKRTSRLVLAAVPGVIAAVVVLVFWNLFLRPTEAPEPTLADKPSIAVLPFDNLSGDPEQEYFSDGMSEDIITDLSKISGLFVIARNSSFVYKGQAVDIKQVAKELGVRYVLEGRVRRAGDQIRMNAQLIDASTGAHLWAERFDGKRGDIFALQDRITSQIVAALAVTLTPEEHDRVALKETGDADAYDIFLKGWDHLHQFTPTSVAKAKDYFEQAIELDPEYGRAYAALAWTYRQAATWNSDAREWAQAVGVDRGIVALVRSHEYLREAMKHPTALSYRAAAIKAMYYRRYEEAMAFAERAVAMEANDPGHLLALGRVLIYAGEPERALDLVRYALKLDPQGSWEYQFVSGYAHLVLGKLDEAATEMERVPALNPKVVGYMPFLASAYALLGREQEATELIGTWRKRTTWPFTVPLFVDYLPFRDPEVAARVAQALSQAGLPGDPGGFHRILPENRLTGEEIRQLVFGRTLTGTHWDRRIRNEVDKSGNAQFSGGWGSDQGFFWIEDDSLCSRFSHRFEGRQICSDVFRNPDGAAETEDEYLFVSDRGVVSLSVVETGGEDLGNGESGNR